MPGLMADQRRLLEGHADLVSTYPNDPAAPDHTISLGHQLKPIWNIGRIRNFDCSSVDRDVPNPTACARSSDRNKCRFVDLGTRMPASLVHIPIATPLASIKGKAAPCWHYQRKLAGWGTSSGHSRGVGARHGAFGNTALRPYRRILPCEDGKLAGATKSLREGLSKCVTQDNDRRSATTS
jgi:hypothetical protein